MGAATTTVAGGVGFTAEASAAVDVEEDVTDVVVTVASVAVTAVAVTDVAVTDVAAAVAAAVAVVEETETGVDVADGEVDLFLSWFCFFCFFFFFFFVGVDVFFFSITRCTVSVVGVTDSTCHQCEDILLRIK